MFFFQIALMALRGLRANLLRSLLATLGVIIGVGAVISAMSVLEGSQRNIRERLESMGGETIIVYPATARVGGRAVGTYQTLTLEDAEHIHANCENIQAAAPEVSTMASVKFFQNNTEATVLGTNEQYAKMFNYKVIRGRNMRRDEVSAGQKVAVLGYRLAEELFKSGPAINYTIKINSVSFRVIGVMEEKGNIGFRNVDKQVMVPVTTAMSRLLGVSSLQSISVQAMGQENVDAAIKEIKGELRKRHEITLKPGARDDFEVFSQEEGRRQVREVTDIFGFVLYSIAGISLVVGGIGIMNIMLVSVTERTREIGVRMAVGAQSIYILAQFLIEAGVISLLGGAFGVALGYGLSHIMGNVQDLLDTYTPKEAVYIALTMAIITGLLSGFYPAYKASRLDPVEALRYE